MFNLTVTSRGRQYDRLGIVYLGDNEVFRTSTAEPTANGIIWTYLKDMTPFLCLLSEPQKIIFDLGNLVNDKYTGTFNITLTAYYYLDHVKPKAPNKANVAAKPKPADMIIPVSKRNSAANAPSAFTLPGERAIAEVVLPRNAAKAVVTVAACGQIGEEFWWGNVPSSLVKTFPEVALEGHSAFREVQVWIDGQLAGCAWPFPVIFTGGVVPGLWSPIVGVDAFDLREEEIDVTPFLPLLRDGQPHAIEIRVAGLEETPHGWLGISYDIGSYWVVTGKIFVWIDDTVSAITAGEPPVPSAPDLVDIVFSDYINKDPNGTNTTLHYYLEVKRRFNSTSFIETSNGSQIVEWTQELRYRNKGIISDKGSTQSISLITDGKSRSSSFSPFPSSATARNREFAYALDCDSTFTIYADSANFSIAANITLGKFVAVDGSAASSTLRQQPREMSHLRPELPQSPYATLSTRQNGTAVYTAVPSEARSFGRGETEQWLVYDGKDQKRGKKRYQRHVAARDRRIVFDDETTSEMGGGEEDRQVAEPVMELGVEEDGEAFEHIGARRSVQEFLGRGPSL